MQPSPHGPQGRIRGVDNVTPVVDGTAVKTIPKGLEAAV